MKLAILLAASLLTAETHNFKEVNFNGAVLKNVSLVMNNNSFNIWYKDKLLKNGKYMIISCKTREGFCLVEKDSICSWIDERR